MTEETKVPPVPDGIFTEAPASVNFFGVTRKGWNLQFTIRDWDEVRLLSRFIAFTTYLEEKGVSPKPVGQQPAPPPTGDPAAKIAREAGNTTLANELEAAVQDVPESDYDEYLDFARLVIWPQPDDRVNLEFYVPGHKYADVKVNKWKTAQASGLLKHLMTADVTKPGDFNVSGRVFWKQGKEYQPGKFYKDVTHVRPIA